MKNILYIFYMNKIYDNGYLVINNCLNSYDFNLCYNAITHTHVNYSIIKTILDNKLINKLNKELNWNAVQ